MEDNFGVNQTNRAVNNGQVISSPTADSNNTFSSKNKAKKMIIPIILLLSICVIVLVGLIVIKIMEVKQEKISTSVQNNASSSIKQNNNVDEVYFISKYINPFSQKVQLLYLNPFSIFIGYNPFNFINKDYDYPIDDLGNCSSKKECHIYCSQYENKERCKNFGENAGIYSTKLIDPKNNKISELVDQKELGCQDAVACYKYCEEESNYGKCTDFAEKNNALGGIQYSEKIQEFLLEKAEYEFSCSSFSECYEFCENENNKNKCDDFAKKYYLPAGNTKAGAGGCKSYEECEEYCSIPANKKTCDVFSSYYK